MKDLRYQYKNLTVHYQSINNHIRKEKGIIREAIISSKQQFDRRNRNSEES